MGKIDDLIATRVLGYIHITNDQVTADKFGIKRPIYNSWMRPDQTLITVGDFSPSTDMNMAWPLTEFDCDDFCFHTYMYRYKEGYYGPHWCGISKLKRLMSRHEPIVWGRGATAQLAICTAALLIFGVTQKEINEAIA